METGDPVRMCLVLVTCFCCNSPAFGAIIARHDPSIIGNGTAPQDGFNITLDTETGLEWLDVSLSTNRVIPDVRANQAPGGDFAGFRFAWLPEVELLVDHLEIANSGGEDPAVTRAIELLGDTEGALPIVGQLASLNAIFVEAYPGANWFLDISDHTEGAVVPDRAEFGYAWTAFFTETPVSWMGYAMVRSTPVPEPSALALASLALACGGAWAMSRRVCQRLDRR